ncbi:MAG TPA: M1 family aminopeptidase [Bacteroidia bacterium]|nr:M1 family aminopeptidase [Bacteroidia bacterium]
MKNHFLRFIIAYCLFASASHASAQSEPVSNVTSSLGETKKDSLPKKQNLYRSSNTRSSEILHSKLELSFNWTMATMNGKASLTVKPHFYPSSQLFLNAKGMEIRGVQAFYKAEAKGPKSQKDPELNKVQSLKLNYRYENDSLKIDLGRNMKSSDLYTLVVDYVAKPNELKKTGGSAAITEDRGLYFINPKGENPYKMPQIWTQGETQANSIWFPTIDSPNQKMSQDIYITVDAKYTTLSNGLLVDSKPAAGGTRTDHWKLEQVHAPYLAMMAIGEFKKVIDKPWKGKEISYYVEKEYEPHAKAIFGDTPEMIDFFSKVLGVDYPWPKYAQVVVRDYVSGAMENTSATLHGDFMVYQTTREIADGHKGNSVIAHELFHQWFGDLVTCESWSNLPLNESFATYGEYIWEEYKFGRDAADYHGWQSRQGYLNSHQENNLIRFEYEDKEDMFDAISYNKGGQVLHMLRKAVGDEAFFASLKLYLDNNRYRSAEIHNLRLAFEEVTGKDLNWFFNQWFLNKGRPKLKVSQTYKASDKQLELSVEQNQDLSKYPLYILPLEIDLYTKSGVQRKHIEVRDQKEIFYLPCESEPLLVNFDAERQLVCELDYNKSKEQYIYQYLNAPLFEDRFEALKKLEDKLAEQDVYELYKKAALGDKFYFLRSYAMGRLEKGSEDKNSELKALLLEVYAKDTKNTNRSMALGILNKKFPSDLQIISLNDKALSESSYAICAEALDAIAKQDANKAMEKAKAFENENARRMIFSLSALYAEHGSDPQIAFFHKALSNVSGFELMTFIGAYTKTAKRCTNAINVLIAANDLEAVSKGAPKFTKFAATKGVKDLLTLWEGKENNLKKALEASKSNEAEFARLDKEALQAGDLREKLNAIYSRMK